MRPHSLALLLVLACSSNQENAGATGSGGSSGAGSGGTSGDAGSIHPCGSGAPCNPGAICSYQGGADLSPSCECDSSGHFMCDPGGGGGPPTECTASAACDYDAGSCTDSNGFCVKTCQCGADCGYACEGAGPAKGEPTIDCAADKCADFNRCQYDDGTCHLKIDCTTKPATVTGSCS